MNFNDYQAGAAKTDITATKGTGVLSISFMDKILGLVGESGEVADKIKKILRDKDAVLSETDRQELSKELGDVLWYIATIAKNLDLSFNDIAEGNLQKLAKRQAENKLGGSGDNR